MKGGGYYTLNEHGEPVYEPDLMTWSHWFEENFLNRRVARTEIGPYTISTVFLGTDHSPLEGSEVPVLWETMVFGPVRDEETMQNSLEMDRCSGTREQALAMHAAMVERITSKERF